jgi:hypothetical protein
MDNAEFQKRIAEMKTDIFPLDLMLPPETVYATFVGEYAKISNKGVFFKNREFQRLREGYFSLFVAASLDDLAGKKHHLTFPIDPSNDIIFAKVTDGADEFPAYRFDVKEFTIYSGSFEEFVQTKIIPKLEIYNLVVATYQYLDGNDLALLMEALREKGSDRRIWLTGSSSPEDKDVDIGRVTVMDKDKILYNEIIDLNERYNIEGPMVIYHDKLRLK